MIIMTTPHGRARRDVRNLKAHLDKQVDQHSRVVEIGNVPLSNADDALRYMERLRDANPRATIAMHHISISPRKRLNEAQRDHMVQQILKALGAEDHAYVLWEHDGKKRAAEGGADHHFHLVLANIGPDMRALDGAFAYRKVEAVAHALEVDFGEPLTAPSHPVVTKFLRNMGRDDVAVLIEANPSDPPRSAMSSKTRAKAARLGVNLPAEQERVRAAWAASDGPAAFVNALREAGLSVVPGKKPGVFVVATNEGVELGALDRIIRMKRADVAARMEGFIDAGPAPAAAPKKSVPEAAVARGGDLSQDTGRGREREEAPPALEPARPARRGRRAARRSDGGSRSDPPEASTSGDVDRGHRPKGRRAWSAAQTAAATLHLAKLGRSRRLKALITELRAPSGSALARLRDELVAREARARADLLPPPKPPEPPALLKARADLREAEKRSTRTFYGTLKPLREARAVLDQPQPRGLWARLSGRRRAWRAACGAAQAEIERIEALLQSRREEVHHLKRLLEPLERREKARRDQDARLRRETERAAQEALKAIERARAALDSDPSLGHLAIDDLIEIANRPPAKADRRYDAVGVPRVRP